MVQPNKLQGFVVHRCLPQRRRYGTWNNASSGASQLSPAISTLAADEEKVAKLAASPIHALKLADLVRHGRPPLTTEALFSSANFTLSILPIRLAHRIQALRNLPFIVVSNPHISQIYKNYLHSLSSLLPYYERRIFSLEDEVNFTEVMADLVQTHANTIPALARGFLESRKYISPAEVTRFLDEHLRARIGTRLIAEQHIALHMSSQPHLPPSTDPISAADSYIGVIDMALRPANIIHNCGEAVAEICEFKYGLHPSLLINGHTDTQFTYVPVHLEYIITELLKNAYRATIEAGKAKEPIEITIAAAPSEIPAPAYGASPNSTTHHFLGTSSMVTPPQGSAPEDMRTPGEVAVPGVTIRIRDRGGGISPANLPNIWSYSFTTFREDSDTPGRGGDDALNAISAAGSAGSSIAGLGYGLPLSRAYAEYFGGSISVQSLWGWGTDVYLSLKGVGKIN
ncbi:MAG: hypothetical protein M1829_002211 [Trizodia sp. TS-e1964]|nr:MAG: hypothetical protein M1829_002211 [Trizodia sp. TS-e1964]